MEKKKIHHGIRLTAGDRVFMVIVYVIIVLLLLLFLYPIIYVISTSFSEGEKIVMEGSVSFLPRGFSLSAYKKIFAYGGLGRYYLNTVWYAFISTSTILLISAITAYPLAHKELPFRRTITLIFTITMFFGGGLIPYYLLIKNIGMMDTGFVMWVPYMLNVWNVIVFKTFFMQQPASLEESARLDGANDFVILFRIIIPISLPLFATFAIFSIVACWNDYFTPLYYIRNINLHPLQLFLRKVLIQADLKEFYTGEGSAQIDARPLRSAAIVVSMLPIMCIYPFFQKYFAKGVIVGSIKG